MADREKVLSWLEGLTDDDWYMYHSDSEVQNIAKAAFELLKEQEDTIRQLRLALKILNGNGIKVGYKRAVKLGWLNYRTDWCLFQS